MSNKKDFLVELIFKKLKNNNSKKINLQKKELNEFINSLIEDN